MKTNPIRCILGTVCLMAATALPALAQDEPAVDLALQPGQLEIVPSFETCSYYYRPQKGARGPFSVEFREAGEGAWRQALEAVSDKPAGIWKGSIFGLREDRAWQLRVLGGKAGTVVAEGEFRTWTSSPPIARVVDLRQLAAENPRGIVISEQGTPDGWIKYTAPEGWVLRREYDPDDTTQAAITFRNARHVILENVTIEGGLRHAVHVDRSDSVRILNCDISGFGRVGPQRFSREGTHGVGMYVDAKGNTINNDEGVEIERSSRTVVERCYIHDPRGRSNSWMFSHPAGPGAIQVNFARGGTVIRWNDLIGSDEHRWNDVIESKKNPSPAGGYYRDSDITGNFMAFGNDDGTELEGGGMNVRFYRNKVEGVVSGVSTGPCHLGPQYVIGNLIANPGDESGLSLMLFKNSHRVEQSGRRYFINNTLYGPDCAAFGAYGKPAPGKRIGYMRNNVIVSNGSREPGDWAKTESFDNDLFWVHNSKEASRKFMESFRKFGQETNAIATDPRFVAPARGDFHLAPDSEARGRSVAVPNITPAGADLGAFYGGVDEVPHRPLAMRAIPRQLEFRTPGENATARVVVSLPATAEQPVQFQIRQNRVVNWFKVTPSSGELKPGDSLTLTVSVDPVMLTGRPLFRGVFLVRTPEGLSRPVTVYAKGTFTENLRPAEAPNTVYLDAAELPGLQKHAQATDAPGVSGGKFVSLGDTGGPSSLAAEIDVPKAGQYYLLLRMSIDSRIKGRAFEVTVGKGGKPLECSTNVDYQWNVADKRFRAVFLCDLGELAAGKHPLRFKVTNGEIRLNQLIITENPAVYFIQHWQRAGSNVPGSN